MKFVFQCVIDQPDGHHDIQWAHLPEEIQEYLNILVEDDDLSPCMVEDWKVERVEYAS